MRLEKHWLQQDRNSNKKNSRNPGSFFMPKLKIAHKPIPVSYKKSGICRFFYP